MDYFYNTTSTNLYNSEDSTSDSESYSDTIEEIYEEENVFIDSEKCDNRYYIGLCKLIKPDNYHLLTNAITPCRFFKYSYKMTLRYLAEFSIIYIHNPKIEIMKLQITEDGSYKIILKTYWLRLVQRHWRNVLLQRRNIFLRRGHVKSQTAFSINGRYPYGLNSLPTLAGMLRHYYVCKKHPHHPQPHNILSIPL